MSFVIGSFFSIVLISLWSFFFYTRDPRREQLSKVLAVLFFGVISFFLSFVILIPLAALMGKDVQTIDRLFNSGHFFMVVLFAFSEELSKLFVLYFLVLQTRSVKDHSDGVLYGGLLGLGFSLVENFFYAVSLDPVSSLMRALLVPLLHASTGAILGFVIVETKIKDNISHQHSLLMALATTTLFHSLYNYFIVISEAYHDLYRFPLFLMLFVWIGLLLAVAYVQNTSRARDFSLIDHSLEETLKESKEEGKTFCYLGLFCALLTLFMIFPVILGPLGIILGYTGKRMGASIWGQRTINFSIAALIVSFLANIVMYYV